MPIEPLFILVTTNLERRIIEHKEGKGGKFTKRYNLIDLLYYEEFTDIEQAILRKKQLKNWHKDWKINLIKEKNPTLANISIGGEPETSSG